MKLSKRLIFSFLILMLLASVLAACGGQPVQLSDTNADFVLALPRLVVDIDSNGVPSIAGISPALLSLVGVDVSKFAMDPTYVEWFTKANIQHIEFVQKDDGVYIFVNGELMPHLAWSTDELDTLTETLTKLKVVKPEFQSVLNLMIPILQHTGLNIVLTFPKQPTAEAIPMRDVNAEIKAPTKNEAAAEEPVAVIKADIVFDENGVPSILGVSTAELSQAGLAGLANVGLSAKTMNDLQDAEIEKITVKTTPEGLIVWINDQQLPYLAWGGDKLEQAAGLYSQLYFTPEYEQQRELVNQFLPMLAQVDGEVTLEFPQ
jgi:hypothetical protein